MTTKKWIGKVPHVVTRRKYTVIPPANGATQQGTPSDTTKPAAASTALDIALTNQRAIEKKKPQ